MKNVLLTGATGFLGSHILESLIEHGYAPIILLRSSSDTWRIEHLKSKCEIFFLDELTDVPLIFEKYNVDSIVNTATDYGRERSLSTILNTNLLLPLRLIEEGVKNGVKLFINTDSFFAKEQFNQKYLSNYTTSKKILAVTLEGVAGQLPIANVRLEHVFGESDSETKFVTAILKQVLQNKQEVFLSEGTQKRDFIYVKDVASAFITLLSTRENLTGYNEFEAGIGESITVKEFINIMGDISGTKSQLLFGAVKRHEGEIEDSFANNKDLLKLGWTPKYSVNEALYNMIQKERKRFIDGK
ncbi:NAD-dependent epimerase/dehydratase [Mucilaginibacter sp. SMC90]|uniref:NAD-dependent epimerase/dehydratase family protein n=1 Tax=Mucilaginibacter sp. SMC90 TaxID=2929803 RepID=UPI001FB36CB0|nr:NAD-dependent epimerase/dehydratase [Mucilaginibacter sp. SMC90]UOE48197.1 NAD-dependent epimerase/dehydratase [Mucilaginibacter sp. SMC90]